MHDGPIVIRSSRDTYENAQEQKYVIIILLATDGVSPLMSADGVSPIICFAVWLGAPRSPIICLARSGVTYNLLGCPRSPIRTRAVSKQNHIGDQNW